MPTFAAITLYSLIEPGSSQYLNKSLPEPNPSAMLERRNGKSVAEMKVSRPQIRPELYATPESTPLPTSPSAFSPSPYIINHKRRGPRLLHRFSEDTMSFDLKTKAEERLEKMKEDVSFAVSGSGLVEEELNGSCDDKEELETSHENDLLDIVASNMDSDEESEDFFDPQESMSIASNTDDENGTGEESSQKSRTPTQEFRNSRQEESAEYGHQEVEYELQKLKLNLSMEIEKRKQAEAALNKLNSQWLKIRKQLHFEGITVPEDPTTSIDGEGMDSCLSQQLYVAKFVSEAIGRGRKRSEMEMIMEAQTELKNFEISRLSDRIHYYETVNYEMSQRNQEAREMGGRERLRRRKRKQKWIWGSVAAAVTFGAAALAWSYIPSATVSSSSYPLCDIEQGGEQDN